MAQVSIGKLWDLYERRFDPEFHAAMRSARRRFRFPTAKLRTLAYFQTGGTPSTDKREYWGGTIPWVSAKDFRQFRFEDSEDHITELAVAEATTRRIDSDVMLMVCRSGILQHTLPVMICQKPTAINQDVKAFFPDERLSAEFLSAFFDIFGSQLLPLICKSGATVQSVNTEELMALDIPLPPLPIQRKIVAELDAAYAAKRKADREAAALLASIDDMVLDELGIAKLPPRDTSLATRVFTVSINEVWGDRLDPYYYQSHFRGLTRTIWKDPRTCRLGSVGCFVRGVVYATEDETDSGHSVLRANNISLEEMELDLSDLVYVGDTVEFNPLQKIRKGDVLICAASGSKEHAGKVAYVREEIPDTYIGGFMMALRVQADVNAEYVSAYMQSSLFRSLIYRHLGGTNINNISLELLNKLPLILPDVSVQERIVHRATEIKTKAKELKVTAASHLATAKKRIEAELMGNRN